MSLEPEIEQALASFRHSLAASRLAHAYLIVGSPRGAAGVLAGRIAAMLYCTAPGERPCGQCPKCLHIAARAHPDVLWVEPQKKSRGILKEQIEAVQEHINLTSFEGGWKVVIFMGADRLNPQSANRLLKTLEEPPGKSLFLLVTGQPAALLPTVVSRCQRVVLEGESIAGVELRVAVVEAMTDIDKRTLAGAVARSRKVQDILREVRAGIEKTADQDEDADDDAREESKDSKAIREARIEGLYKEALTELLRWLLLWQRDVLLRVAGADHSVAWAFPDQEQIISRQASVLTCRQALDNIRTVEDMRRQVAQNLPVPMIMERGFIRLTSGECRM